MKLPSAPEDKVMLRLGTERLFSNLVATPWNVPLARKPC